MLNYIDFEWSMKVNNDVSVVVLKTIFRYVVIQRGQVKSFKLRCVFPAWECRSILRGDLVSEEPPSPGGIEEGGFDSMRVWFPSQTCCHWMP